MIIKVKKVSPEGKLPFRATPGSAGADLFACLVQDVSIAPGERIFIPTGIAIAIEDENYGGFVFPRSSVAGKYGVTLSNCVGVIDSDYRGEIKVPLINHGNDSYTIKNGDRIAQLVIMPVLLPVFELAEELDVTDRGEGGFGSTGK